MASIDKLVNNTNAYPLLGVIYSFELVKILHDLRIGCTKHTLDLVHSESTPCSIIVYILDIKDVDMLISLLLFLTQVEEFSTVKP